MGGGLPLVVEVYGTKRTSDARALCAVDDNRSERLQARRHDLAGWLTLGSERALRMGS